MIVSNISEIAGIAQGALGKAVNLKVTWPAEISIAPGVYVGDNVPAFVNVPFPSTDIQLKLL